MGWRTAVVAGVVVAGLGASSAGAAAGTGAEPGAGRSAVSGSGWRMHPIDQQYRGANSLGAADVNGDGLTDYSVNYEFDQRYAIYFHPTAGADARQPWPRVVLTPSRVLRGEGGVASESSALGDLDGDGNVDLVGAQSGDTLAVIGYEPGLQVFWGPDETRVLDASAWEDAGRFPATIDAGHYHWVVTRDVDRDGDLDLMVGGRVLMNTSDPTGILWIESPDDPQSRRDLSQWTVHEIDTDTWSGHGFAFTDVDGDGDEDLVDANEDFDTPEDAEDVAWYENPGPGTEAQRGPWTRRVLYKSPDFTIKPQLGVGDLDGDGLEDFVTQTPDDLIVFRKVSEQPVEIETIVVPKDPAAQWTPRTTRVADLDGDGRNEVIGFLSHENSDVPTTTASVFRMIPPADGLASDGWRTEVVAWGPGVTMQAAVLGSKWDQAQTTDVDGDGDLDIVANNEEWWANTAGEYAMFDDPASDPSSVSVVWFENRLDEKPSRCRERQAECRLQAEWPAAADSGTWVERGDEQASAGIALQAFNGLDPETGCRKDRTVCEGAGPDGEIAWKVANGVRYRADLDGGAYRVWARVRVPSRFSSRLGGEKSDSAWLAVDGQRRVLSAADAPLDRWAWVPLGAPVDLDEGVHELELRVRERGIEVDEIVLRADRKAPTDLLDA